MPASIRDFSDNTVDPKVRGYLHLPATPNNDGLVLTHGAGSNANAPLLIALADTFSAAGFTVLRCDLPYRQSRSFGPPGPGDAARDRAGLRNALAALATELSTNKRGTNQEATKERGTNEGGTNEGSTRERDAPEPALSLPKGLAAFARPGNVRASGFRRIFLGGHSYGGRQSSMLAAEHPDLVAALLLLSYPLHPPRKPDQQRTQHLPDLRTPALFVSGTRDPFGTIAELQQAIKMIPAKTKLLPIEGAGHDLGFKGKAKHGALTSTVLAAFQDLLR